MVQYIEKQMQQFWNWIWNWFSGEQGARAGRPELAWCGSTEIFAQQLEQGCSEPSEGEQDLIRTIGFDLGIEKAMNPDLDGLRWRPLFEILS